MADQASELRHIIEQLVNRTIDAQAAQRGWDLGWDLSQQTSTPSAASGGDVIGIEFATGYDGVSTIVGFLFDVSTLDGADLLV